MSFLATFWSPLHGVPAVPVLLAMATGCFPNAFKNRTCHCAITGPLFLVAALLLLFSRAHLIRLRPAVLWAACASGTVVAFALEWRFARKDSS